jgi:hypothetical protein
LGRVQVMKLLIDNVVTILNVIQHC